jgi:hypothetical protein
LLAAAVALVALLGPAPADGIRATVASKPMHSRSRSAGDETARNSDSKGEPPTNTKKKAKRKKTAEATNSGRERLPTAAQKLYAETAKKLSEAADANAKADLARLMRKAEKKVRRKKVCAVVLMPWCG